MEFAKPQNLEIVLKLEHHGRPFRVSDCEFFAVKVWTQRRDNFLIFSERDVTRADRCDFLAIPDYFMQTLESGVIQYEYDFVLKGQHHPHNEDEHRPHEHFNRHPEPFGRHPHDHTKTVITEIYWKNPNPDQRPSNAVNAQMLNHLRRLIDNETVDRIIGDEETRKYFYDSILDPLNAEVERSTAKDEELKALIDATLEKIEAEVKRSNEVDIELFNAIKKAGETAVNDKEETDQKIEEANTALDEEVARAQNAEKDLNDAITAEADRAKAAERQLTNDLTDEVSRSKVKEAELDAKIDSEVARAKVVEGALSDAVDAVRDRNTQIANDLAAEVSRSNQKDNDHTAALNDETTRAKAAEKAIVDRLDVIEGDKDVVGSVKHAVEDAKHYVDDLIGKVTAGELKDLAEVNNALSAEVSRATTKEAELEAVLAVVNGDAETIGSISHAEANAKKYADEAIAKTLSDHNTDLTNLTNDLNTEVSRATNAEKAITDRLDVAETNLSNAADAIVNLTNKDTEIANDLATEVSRATAKEAEIDGILAVVNGDKETIGSIAHSLEDSKHYTDNQIEKLETQTATNLADALKPYATKDEVDNRIEGVIGTAPAALDTLGEIADRLAEDSDAINVLNGILTEKADKANVYTKAEADAKHTAITNDLATANTAIQNEVSRAENAETLISNKVDAVDAKVDAVKAVADQSASDIADEVNRAKTAETTLSNDLSALDTKIDGVKAVSDKATADIAELSTEITGAKSDINGLTNDLATEVSRATTKETELESGVSANAQKIADLTTRTSAVETAIASAASDLTAEVNRAKQAETDINNALSAEVSRAQTKEGEIESGVTANANAISALADRTTAVEGEINTLGNDVANLKDAMAVVNGNAETIGSIAHAESDAKHYCDDEIAKLTAKVEAEVTGFATKSEVAAVDAKIDSLKSKVDNIDIDAYTKAEVDALIEGVDVSDQLTDYAKTSETTVIKDQDGNIITEMVIDNGDEDDTIEVYTRAQVDEMFANVPKIVTLTQAQYDALANKAPNTLYLVNG